MAKDVLIKRENWLNFTAGKYGNRLLSWDTISDLKRSGWRKDITVRTLLAGGGPCFYDVPIHEVESVASKIGLPEHLICFNEGAVNSDILIQGEYFNGIIYVNEVTYDGVFLYSTVNLKMRDALKERSETVYGKLSFREIMKFSMTPSSFSDLEVLLGEYEDHTLEISVFNKCVGNIPGRNAIVWEVRKY